jgi:hypothetical protein
VIVHYIDACNTHTSTILKLNNDVANLNAQLKICRSDYEKIKFSRDAYTIGRQPSIKDGLGFQKGTKNLTSQRTSNLNKEKGKAPMASVGVLGPTKHLGLPLKVLLGVGRCYRL